MLARSPEYRKNEMVMLEEFRRRKQQKDFHDLMLKRYRADKNAAGLTNYSQDFDREQTQKDQNTASLGPERFFEPKKNEVFNPNEFTLIFLDSDSVTNVTSLNRVNHRRVLIFIGDGNGLIGYGKGKGEDYEQAFNNAFKKMRQNLVCLSLDVRFSSQKRMEGRHNDFRIQIFPQATPNYWGNPTIWKMLLHSGFGHCRYVCKSRKRDPYSLVYAFFLAVTQNKTPDEIA